MAQTGWFPSGQSEEDRNRQLFVAVTGLQAFAAADEIEAMIAAQAMAAHHASIAGFSKAKRNHNVVMDGGEQRVHGFKKGGCCRKPDPAWREVPRRHGSGTVMQDIALEAVGLFIGESWRKPT
jgi:hypothetical protein